jgi:hypothetical protein
MAVIINASTSTGLVQSADTSGIIQFQSNGTTKATLNSSGFSYPGAVLQVVQTVKTDSFSTTGATPVDITGMSATITPISSSNKILVLCQVSTGGDDKTPRINLVRNSTTLMQPASDGSTIGSDARSSGVRHLVAGTIQFLDSPATTSATTYKLQLFNGFIAGGGTVFFNRSGFQDSGVTQYATSSITLMEIAV